MEKDCVNEGISIGVFPGGGTQGLISVYTAEAFTAESGRAFHENFDQIEGLSVGALNAATLWPLESTGRPLMTPAQLKDFYLNQVDGAFESNLLALGGLLDHKYDIEELEALINDTFGDLKLSDFADGLHIHVLDVEQQEVRVLSSEAAKLDPAQDFMMRDLLRTAISAPFYFEPVAIQNMAGEDVKFIDAGVFSSDPSYMAYFALQHSTHCEQPVALTAFGTGHRHNEEYELEDLDGGAMAAGEILSLMFKSKMRTFSTMLDEELGGNYVNLDVDISGSDMGLVADNIADVVPYGEKAVRDNAAGIRKALDNIENIRTVEPVQPAAPFASPTNIYEQPPHLAA